MIRRDFFNRLAGGAGVMALGRELWGETHRRSAAMETWDKRNRISISTWSLHNYFQTTRAQDFTLPGNMLALLDLRQAPSRACALPPASASLFRRSAPCVCAT